jgi:hypothetical protein
MMEFLRRKVEPAAVGEPSGVMVAVPYDLAGVLEGMAQHGQPVLAQYADGTWSCRVKLRTQLAGTELEVKSDFKHKTPVEAVHTCLTRMYAVLPQAGGL